MDQSFAVRLSRIQATNESVKVPSGQSVDLIGTSQQNALKSMQELYPLPEPQTYEQKFRKAIVNNLFLGLIWMIPTGYGIANFFPVADFFAGTEPTKEVLLHTQYLIGAVLAVSIFLFNWVGRQAIRDLGKAHGTPASLAIGGLLGGLIGAGPITVFKFFAENQAGAF